MQHPLVCTQRQSDLRERDREREAQNRELHPSQSKHMLIYQDIFLGTHASLKSLIPPPQLYYSTVGSTNRPEQYQAPGSTAKILSSIPHSLHQHLADICAVPALSICHGGQKTNDRVSAAARLHVWYHTGAPRGCGEGRRQEGGPQPVRNGPPGCQQAEKEARSYLNTWNSNAEARLVGPQWSGWRNIYRLI